MDREALERVREDVERLESLHDQAVDALEGFEQAEEAGLEFLPMLTVAVSIRQAMDECVEFDAHFRKKYGAKEEREA